MGHGRLAEGPRTELLHLLVERGPTVLAGDAPTPALAKASLPNSIIGTGIVAKQNVSDLPCTWIVLDGRELGAGVPKCE